MRQNMNTDQDLEFLRSELKRLNEERAELYRKIDKKEEPLGLFKDRLNDNAAMIRQYVGSYNLVLQERCRMSLQMMEAKKMDEQAQQQTPTEGRPTTPIKRKRGRPRKNA